jgi:hypothetical protein
MRGIVPNATGVITFLTIAANYSSCSSRVGVIRIGCLVNLCTVGKQVSRWRLNCAVMSTMDALLAHASAYMHACGLRASTTWAR